MQREAGQLYFARWAKPLADKFGQQPQDESFGTYGLKKNYVLDTPLAEYAPLQSSELNGLLVNGPSAQSLVAAALTAPAGLIAYKTVAPAVASVFGGGH